MPFWRAASTVGPATATERAEPATTITTTARAAAGPSSSDALQQRLQRLQMWRPVALA